MSQFAALPHEQGADHADHARWPVTVGVISIVFAAIHLLSFAAFWTLSLSVAGADEPAPPPILTVLGFLTASVGKAVAMVLLLIGGIQLIRRKPSARGLYVAYAVLALLSYGAMGAILLVGLLTEGQLDPIAAGVWLAVQGAGLLCGLMVLVWFFRPKARKLVDAWRIGGPSAETAMNPYAAVYSQPYSPPPQEPPPATAEAEEMPQAAGQADQAVASPAPPPLPKPAETVLVADLQRRFKSGAKWFHWIAVLSLFNTAIMLAGGGLTFVIGLGITQLITGLGEVAAEDMGPLAKQIALGLVIVCAGVFFLFGRYALRRRRWAFVTGMVLYALDGLIFIPMQDWWSFGFHIFALFGLYGGLRAERQLRRLEADRPEAQAVDPAGSGQAPEALDR